MLPRIAEVLALIRSNALLAQLAEVEPQVRPVEQQSLPAAVLAGGFVPRQLARRQRELAASIVIGAVVLHAADYRHDRLIGVHEIT